MNTCAAQKSAVIANPWLTTHTTLHPPLSITSFNSLLNCLNPFQRPIQTQPKVNLLRCSTDATSLLSFVTACIDLIHEFTCACEVFGKELSLSSLGGWEMLGRDPDDSACSTARWMTGWIMRCFGDFDVLEEGKIELGEFLFGHWDASR